MSRSAIYGILKQICLFPQKDEYIWIYFLSTEYPNKYQKRAPPFRTQGKTI